MKIIKIRFISIALMVTFLFFLSSNSFSQLQITPGISAQQLANILCGQGVTVSNAFYSGGVNSRGSYVSGNNLTNLGIYTGIILSTGSVMDAIGPNTSGSTTGTNGTGSDLHLAALIPGYTINDACYLQFDFIPESDNISFRYVFASDEYPEWVGSSFNDVFGFFLSGPGINGTFPNNSVNLALIPGTNLPVAIDNINTGFNSQYYVNNIGGYSIEYDGFTVVLTAWAQVIPFQQYTIKIAIGDAGDSAYDSAVFLESESLVSKQTVSGYVYKEDNNNCNMDSNEMTIPYRIVKINRDSVEFYTITNTFGKYELCLPAGDYIIEPLVPLFWNLICPISGNYDFTVVANEIYDTLDFGLKSIANCPWLNVSITGGAMRPCFNSQIAVQYSNQGGLTSDDTYIEIEFDDDLTPVSSTLPWSAVQGNTYTFEVGSLNMFETGSFNVILSVACDLSLVGHTRCMDAQIFASNTCVFLSPGLPDTIQNTVWDHSSVSVGGECVNDSLACFTIRNTGNLGNGDMLQASEYRIFANDTLVFLGTFQLQGGDSLNICWPTDGYAIRLEAVQSLGHPGFSYPSKTIEDCGDLYGTSLGYITTVPLDDQNADIDIFCNVITNSCDPNDKQVQPSGITVNNYISNDAALSYHINFQNTGTDTAFTVVILDTLSPYLDVTTLEIGASSHTNIINLTDQGILIWTFTNIMLPDSGSNEDESKGFVSYKIAQKPLLPPSDYGTVISNKAYIFFDHNEPIITNQVDLVYWELPLIITHIPIVSTVKTLIYPNPASFLITVELQDIKSGFPVSFQLKDISGKQVNNESTHYTNVFNVDISGLRPGIYLYQIYNKSTIISQGKIIIQR